MFILKFQNIMNKQIVSLYYKIAYEIYKKYFLAKFSIQLQVFLLNLIQKQTFDHIKEIFHYLVSHYCFCTKLKSKLVRIIYFLAQIRCKLIFCDVILENKSPLI